MTNVESSPEINGLGDYMQKVFIWNVNMQLTGRGMNQQALCAPLGLKKGAVSAKMTGKTTWTIQDIAAVAEFLNVSPLYLLDATMYEQMMRGMSGDGGASLVAVATAGFPVRPSEGQADGLKPLETKGSGPRYLVEPGAGEYPQRGGYERQLPQEQTANPSNVYLLIINLNFRYSNDSRLLPVDTRAVLLLSVIFMRLMAETTCDE